ncbi:MAG: C40 family peptidase [Bacteroidia bacterium]|nr:C40 family peptidase [Bacteroidia bacterium]
MQSGICLLSVVAARKEPSGSSEMVTQLLFGDYYTVLEQTESWLKIVTAFDNYECWISAKQHHKISPGTLDKLKSQSSQISSEFIHSIQNVQTGVSFPISMGASLPFYNQNRCVIEGQEFVFDGKTVVAGTKNTAENILNTARQFLNAPYLWGGKTPFGIDCSGFTQTVYKLNGYQLPRDAYQQVELGSPLSFVEEAEAGDLAFFDNEEGRITHVGILLNNQEIIHASGFVKIEKFDHYGIYNAANRGYSHTLRVIKRIL